jgi:hypothetical protein
MSRHRFALIFLAAAVTPLFLLPLLGGEVLTLRDHFDYFQPVRWFTATELLAGRVPLWNPYNASGEAWLANPQTGVFYPPSWLFLILPFPAAYMLFLLLHVLILGWGAHVLFARRLSQGAALVGAVALAFSGPVLSLLDVSNNLATLAWIPLALWCAAEGAWRRGGLVLALAFLGGEPFFAAVGAAMYVVAAMRVREKRVAKLALAAVTAFGMSAIQLFPFLEMVRRSDRAAGLDASLILMNSMSWGDWLRIAIPPKLDEGAIDKALSQQFIPVVYVGVVVCALALTGLAAARRRSSTVPWVVLLVCCVIVSTGPAVLARLPLTLFRYPARLVPLAALALAALAAIGWERLRGERRWVDLVVVLLIVIDLVPRTWALFRSAPFRRDVVPYARTVGAESKFLRAGVIDATRRQPWISGYLNLYDRRFDASTAAPVAAQAYVRVHRGLLENPTREELARKGIGWVVTTHDLRPAFLPAARAGNVTVYRNRATLPMAFLTTRSPLSVHPAHAQYDSSHVRVSVDAPREGVLVVLQQRAPGWRVTIDGVEAREFPIDELFRGVQITRGHHEVVWTYRPRSLFFGAWMTLLTLLTVTLSRFVKRA